MSETIATRIARRLGVRGYSLAGEAPIAPPARRSVLLALAAAEGWRAPAVAPASGRSSPLRSTSHSVLQRGDRARRAVRAAAAGARRWPGARSSSAALARRCVRRPPAAAVAAGSGGRGARRRARPAPGWPSACRCRRCPLRASPAGAAIAVGLDHPVVARLGRRSAQGERDRGRARAAGAGAAAVAVTRRYPRGWWLPAGGRVGGVRRRAGRARAGRARPGLQRLHAAARGRDARRRARARARPPASRWGRCTRSTPAAGRPPPTPT